MATEKAAEGDMRQGEGRECCKIREMDVLKKAQCLDIGNPADVDFQTNHTSGRRFVEK
jgi:hypothetical protein